MGLLVTKLQLGNVNRGSFQLPASWKEVLKALLRTVTKLEFGNQKKRKICDFSQKSQI
jgi:hypothetical protein